MKVYQLLICVLLCIGITESYSQDFIYKSDGSEIEAKITEITLTTIKYKRFNQLSGPIRNILISDVFMIIYENCKREVFKSKEIVKKSDKGEAAEQEIYKRSEATVNRDNGRNTEKIAVQGENNGNLLNADVKISKEEVVYKIYDNRDKPFVKGYRYNSGISGPRLKLNDKSKKLFLASERIFHEKLKIEGFKSVKKLDDFEYEFVNNRIKWRGVYSKASVNKAEYNLAIYIDTLYYDAIDQYTTVSVVSHCAIRVLFTRGVEYEVLYEGNFSSSHACQRRNTSTLGFVNAIDGVVDQLMDDKEFSDKFELDSR